MRFRRLGSLALIVLVGITFGIGLQGAAAQDPLLQEAVEFTGAVLFLEHKVPGLVIGAIRGPERAVSGFGETGKGTGVSPGEQTVFRIGSVTKAFTGEVLASLVAGGTVKLTDPLEKHLGWDVAIPTPPLIRAVSDAKCRTTLVRLTIRLRPLLKNRSKRRSVAIGSFSRLGLARSIQTWGSICLLRPSQARQARPTPIFCASASRRFCG
jgi:hypothetical protein